MAENYPIIQVQPEWALEPEDMGTKEKFWYRPSGENRTDWLYKQPRPGSGRELQDRKRGLLLAENRVGAYSDKARGEIFWSEEDRRPPSPLDW